MKKIHLMIITIILLQFSLSASDTKYIHSQNNDAAVMNQIVSALSNQLTQNKDFINIQDSTIAITSFVCLENFKSTSRLSNILSENLIHEMQIRGYKIIDFKTMENIQINHHGDFLFSRDISKLNTTLNISYALTGTYTKYKSGTVVNARIIDLNTHVILSTAQILIPKKVMKSIMYDGHRIPNFVRQKISLAR